MLGVRSASKLTGGAGSKDWRWHNGIHVKKMSPMYHMGKNGVKTGEMLRKELRHGKGDDLPETNL